MLFAAFNFRLAYEILEQRPEWIEFRGALDSIAAEDILAAQEVLATTRRKAPAGAQTALNQVIRGLLAPLGWIQEPRLFDSQARELAKWKMDFLKQRTGVEISFNHAEAIPWTFTRLNIAGESEQVYEAHKIDVGIAAFACADLKAWGRMDAAVGTYEQARIWLGIMRPIMPIPVLVLGLSSEGFPQTSAFRGTRQFRD